MSASVHQSDQLAAPLEGGWVRSGFKVGFDASQDFKMEVTPDATWEPRGQHAPLSLSSFFFDASQDFKMEVIAGFSSGLDTP
jgi:hypothetical protein